VIFVVPAALPAHGPQTAGPSPLRGAGAIGDASVPPEREART